MTIKKSLSLIHLISVHIVLRGYMYSFELWESFRVLYECFPRTLRTPLNTSYTPNTSNTSNELNTSNLSGFPLHIKKLILTRWNAWRGKWMEWMEWMELLRGL